MPLPETVPAQWFAQEVHPHETSLWAYLRGSFPGVRDVDDIVQEYHRPQFRFGLGLQRPTRRASLCP